jgi:hypothetical protein
MRARRPGRARVALGLLAVLAAAACGPSPEEEAADLCRDLRNLDRTFELLLVPPDDATVGEVRGALEKVAPFLDRLAAPDATDGVVDAELEVVEEAFRDAFDGLGDDGPATAADAELRGDRPRLAAAVADAAAALGCRA